MSNLDALLMIKRYYDAYSFNTPCCMGKAKEKDPGEGSLGLNNFDWDTSIDDSIGDSIDSIHCRKSTPINCEKDTICRSLLTFSSDNSKSFPGTEAPTITAIPNRSCLYRSIPIHGFTEPDWLRTGERSQSDVKTQVIFYLLSIRRLYKVIIVTPTKRRQPWIES
ncbi:hypothetical protein HPP92_028973 [Vanilla planifolia]|uniref:Uncharacterized protein n=1 Tax=Vanilla planifolia TaxID=51239 RepID=A0A835P436_VANPL|nr:hypothetical protein HPP92_028973 [Vanilla planifolia]KAG0446173.1 hypothetical protein HPP92_028962 [Vanilla planifolia]